MYSKNRHVKTWIWKFSPTRNLHQQNIFHSGVTFHYQPESVISNMYGTDFTFTAQPPGAWQWPWLQKDKLSNSRTDRGWQGLCRHTATWSCCALHVKTQARCGAPRAPAQHWWEEGVPCHLRHFWGGSGGRNAMFHQHVQDTDYIATFT